MPYTPRQTPAAATGMQAYVLAYIEHLKARNYATQSVEYKHASLNWFLDWCGQRGISHIQDITRPVLQRYQRHLFHAIVKNGKPLSIQSQCNRLTAIRTWFRFLMRENLILYNPASELELPKRERRLPKHTLTVEEAERVLSQPAISTAIGIRDRAILEVLYSTGIRRMELINLTIPDMNMAAGIVSVRQGKGRKDRFVPIGERAIAWVTKYLDDGRPQHSLPSNPDPLFIDETGERLGAYKLSRLVKKYIDAAAIGKRGSTHLFRHTMATLMLENGADIRFIQQILGHALLSTTEIYTHVAIHKLKEIHTATHPARLRRDADSGTQETPEQSSTETELIDTLDAEADEDAEP